MYKLIHSFSTRPLQNKSLYGIDRLHHLISDIWLYTLSAAYAKREGFIIDLHTDSLGALLLSKAPYDHIYTTLDNMPKEIHPRFWAAGKVWALEAEKDNDVIHIDGDLFIKDAKLLDFKDVDFVVQNVENANYYKNGELKRLPRFGDFCIKQGFNPYGNLQYNTGILGIFNPELKQKYLSAYKDFVLKASKEFDKELKHDYVTPDLFAEQQLFSALSKDYKGLCIVKNEKICPKGFLHLITGEKYTEEIMNKVKQVLNKYFHEIYNETFKICQNI